MRIEATDIVAEWPVIDVRTPAEFKKGHIPGAVNLPLFSNQERHEVGLCYKNEGSDQAIRLGLELVEGKLGAFVDQAREFAPDRKVNLYCWRGGMRSGSMNWLLETAGFQTRLINGGYKAWRNLALQTIRRPYRLLSLSGFTGVGKTDILYALRDLGEQVIDLEALANHQGSAFVSDQRQQPSSEHFENLLAAELILLDPEAVIWIEDESRAIGKVYLDNGFYHQLAHAHSILINRPYQARVDHLCHQYGAKDMTILKEGFHKIKKRIGGQNLNAAINYLDQGDLASAAKIALTYYDHAYMKSMSKLGRIPILSLSLKNKTFRDAAKELKSWKDQLDHDSQS